MVRCRTAALAAAMTCSSVTGPWAAPVGPCPIPRAATDLVVPVVLFGRDGRRSPDAFARQTGLDARALRAAHAASGLVTCGDAHGAGQLTLAADVVTTAAHVLFDERGVPRSRGCNFEAVVDGRPVSVPIDPSSVVAGSVDPYSKDVSFDWAVARLARRVPGVVPYGLADDVRSGQPTTFVSRGHVDWGRGREVSMQDCALREQLLADRGEGTREFSFDCDTGDGASGGALMFGQSRASVGAILVGWRSNRPWSALPFSMAHYNFAVTVEGDFREAVLSAVAVGSRISQR